MTRPKAVSATHLTLMFEYFALIAHLVCWVADQSADGLASSGLFAFLSRCFGGPTHQPKSFGMHGPNYGKAPLGEPEDDEDDLAQSGFY